MASRILKANFADAYDLRIQTQWMQGYGEPEHEFQQVYATKNITNQDTRFSHVTPFGRWSRKDSTSDTIPYDTIYQGYDVTITPYTYWMGFTIDQETWEDDPTGILSGDLATALAQAGRETLEYLMAVPFEAPTAAPSFAPWMPGGDGVALLSLLHPIVTGGVYANTPATQIGLSIAALEASWLRLAKMQNSRGLPWPMKGARLVHAPDNKFLVDEIFGSTNAPFTANNQINAVKNLYEPFQWSNLTSTGAWFVMAAKAGGVAKKGHQILCIMRISPEFERDNVFESGDRRYKGRFRVGAGYPDWRGVDGSLGNV